MQGTGAVSRFDTTRWSVVLQAQGQGDDARGALESLCRTYRPAVLAYIRSRGHRDDAAEDLTQAFFASFLERGHASADPARGRFRAYLLGSIKHFLINADLKERRVKRGGRVRIEALDADAEDLAGSAPGGDDPERVFEQSWALAIIAAALRRLRREAQRAGKGELFDQLRDFLAEAPSESDYARIAGALQMRRNTVAVAVHRLRQRLRELVRAEVAQTAAGRTAFEAELRALRGALGDTIQPDPVEEATTP